MERANGRERVVKDGLVDGTEGLRVILNVTVRSEIPSRAKVDATFE